MERALRADAHAESEIRALALRLFACLAAVDPILFGDYRVAVLSVKGGVGKTTSTINLGACLAEQGRKVRVVSMPCTSVFDAQDAAYKQLVLPVEVGARIAIEAAHADYWYKYVGLDGRIIGMTTYGESAPASALFEAFGFTLENILENAAELLDA